MLKSCITVNLSNKGIDNKTEKPESQRNLKFEFDKSVDDDKEESYSQKIKKRSLKIMQSANQGRNSLENGANVAMIQSSSQNSSNKQINQKLQNLVLDESIDETRKSQSKLMQINELDSDKEYSVKKDPTNQAPNFFIDEASEAPKLADKISPEKIESAYRLSSRKMTYLEK